MSVNLVIRDSKFFNQFKNDLDFTANTGDFTNNLTGLVGEIVKYTYTIDVSWISKSSEDSAQWTFQYLQGLNYRVKKNTPSPNGFSDDGFAVNDSFQWVQTTPVSFSVDCIIDSITSDWMYFSASSAFWTPVAETNNNADVFYGFTPLTAMKYKFGIIGNEENFNIESKVSGNDQGYYGTDIGFDTGGGVRDLNWVDFTRIGQYADWDTGNMRVRFISTTDYVQKFEVEHIFMITPFYIEGELPNLTNNITPNLLDGENSLKYVFEPGFRTVLNNPNTEKVSQESNNLGSVGWFNENFNGFDSNYIVSSVAYEEEATTNSADGILISSKTKITINIEKSNGNFSVGERAGIYVFLLPEQTSYTNTTLTDLKENFLYDNVISNGGLAAVAGQDFITNYEIINIVGNTMTLTFDVEYSIAQKIRLANLNSTQTTNFVIGVQLGDVTLTSGNSDRIVLLADVNEYDESADIPDLWSFPKFDIYTHEKQIGVDSGTTDVTAWNEDGIVVDYTMNLDLNKDAVLNSMDFILVAYDPITKIYFEINKYSFNMFPAVVSSGIQQLITNTNRGYILGDSDQFNDVFLEVGANVADVQSYDGRIAQKFSWQDWIENLNVDTVFFDASKPNNNFSLKTSDYSMLNGYEIRLAFAGNLFGTNDLGVQGLTNYLVLSPTLTVFDYEKDGLVTPIWSETIETYNENATTNLGGSILTGQNTLFRSTWTNSGGPVTSLVGLWGINRIELTNQPGYAITEISTLYDQPINFLLKPTVGFTKMDIYLDSGNVVFECLIDGSIAQPNVSYNLSTRIQDDNAVVLGAKITEQGVLKDTEQGIQKIIE